MSNPSTSKAFPTWEQLCDKMLKRQQRIAAGDTKLVELHASALAAGDAHRQVEDREVEEARKRAADSPEYAVWQEASKRLSEYEAELDAAEVLQQQA